MISQNATRLDAVRLILQTKKLDALLLTDSVDAEYVSGFHSSNIMVLITARTATIFTDSRYEAACRTFCTSSPQWRFVKIVQGGFTSLRAPLSAVNTLGVSYGQLSHASFLSLAALRPTMKTVDVGADVAAVTAVKTSWEIDSMRAAASIADAALAALLPKLDASWTEEKTAAELEILCRKKGSSGPSFSTIVLFGENSALPHGVPGKRRLKKGDFILIDFGCTVNGFCSDMTRTFVYGAASKKHRDIYAAVLDAHDRALEKVTAGTPCGMVDKAARSHITARGYGKLFGHATGHGVGRNIHEFPRVKAYRRASKSSDTVVAPDTVLGADMVVTVEPGIYMPGFGGVRIEDMAHVTNKGYELLTGSPRELIVLR